jgi:hypothetical protein
MGLCHQLANQIAKDCQNSQIANQTAEVYLEIIVN